MKRFILLVLVVSIFFITPVFAVDFSATLETVTEMQRKVGKLHEVVSFAKEAKFSRTMCGDPAEYLGEVPLTAAQITTLTTKYQTLKSELQILFQQLP